MCLKSMCLNTITWCVWTLFLLSNIVGHVVSLLFLILFVSRTRKYWSTNSNNVKTVLKQCVSKRKWFQKTKELFLLFATTWFSTKKHKYLAFKIKNQICVQYKKITNYTRNSMKFASYVASYFPFARWRTQTIVGPSQASLQDTNEATTVQKVWGERQRARQEVEAVVATHVHTLRADGDWARCGRCRSKAKDGNRK